MRFARNRSPQGDIEYRIYGSEDVPMAAWHMCEECADQYYNITELGYCVLLPDNMLKLAKQTASCLLGDE